ncbi:ATP synthase subunit I [Tsukamurella ocularis]|uniref:ATP synthase subunit I n=1 Tax=Tsukamurella ocularis TaxID=1970234 RepID=UPI002167C301|nr:ATP synthase subunit I [Tsukamurella ocularis]MCS3780609.1 fatty acid desaturase [Tsukamurella ocularis]MCS3786433.1 fatty acid desaturase [Tsukamurella ocularis]MCS3850275.1 fatty acid desaturase [Tsukamurella ocularis]
MTTPAPSVDRTAPRGVVTFANPFVILAGISVVVAGVAAAYDEIWFGAWFFVGGLLALLNAKLAVLKVSVITADDEPRKAPVAVNSMVRLAVVTVVALVIAYFLRPAGLGVIFGLAVGQVVLVLNTVIPVLKGLRQQS